MKLLMFRNHANAADYDGQRRLGALRPGHEDEVVDLSEVATDVLAVIDAGERGLAQAHGAAADAKRGIPLSEVTLLAPIDSPRGNIIAMGVVIGKPGANITRRDAMDHVFGYFVLNDVSARDIQNGWGGQFFKGKSIDRSCPTGPWVVTKDEVPDPGKLALRLTLNGVVKQDSNTEDMIHPVDAIIEWSSKGMTLLAGALIATGTPDGVGFARTPPEYLKAGDVMETEVAGIGVLRNRIVPAKVGALR